MCIYLLQIINTNPSTIGGLRTRHHRQDYSNGHYKCPEMDPLQVPQGYEENQMNMMSPMTTSDMSGGQSSMISKDDMASHASSANDSYSKKQRTDRYVPAYNHATSLSDDSMVISVPGGDINLRSNCTPPRRATNEEYIQKLVEASNGAGDDADSLTEYDERAQAHLRRNLRLVVRQKVFCEKKFLTEKSLLMMKYGSENELPRNVLGMVLVNLNKDRCTVLERVVFWKRWGMEVKRTLNDLKSSVSRMLKDVVLKGEIKLSICVCVCSMFKSELVFFLYHRFKRRT